MLDWGQSLGALATGQSLQDILAKRRLEQLAAADRAEKIRQFNVGAEERARWHDLESQRYQNTLQQQAEVKKQAEIDRQAAAQGKFFEGMTPAADTGALRTISPQTAAGGLLSPYSGQVQRTIPVNEQGQWAGAPDVFQATPGRQWVEKRQEAADKLAAAEAARNAQPPRKPDILVDPSTGRIISQLPEGAGTHLAPHPPQQTPDLPITLSPAALDMVAKQFAQGGQLPPMGMGKAGTTVRQAIITRAAQYDPASDTFKENVPAPNLAGAQANLAANRKTLTDLTQRQAAVEAFANTAKKNAALMEDTLKDVPDTGLPLLNRPLRAVASAFGTPP